MKNWMTKAMGKVLHCKFIRANWTNDEKHFDTYGKIGKIYNDINKSSQKSLSNEISKKSSELEFKPNHSKKLICLKPVVKKYCHHYNTGKIGFKL